jgi:hypothetical protein
MANTLFETTLSTIYSQSPIKKKLRIVTNLIHNLSKTTRNVANTIATLKVNEMMINHYSPILMHILSELDSSRFLNRPLDESEWKMCRL